MTEGATSRGRLTVALAAIAASALASFALWHFANRPVAIDGAWAEGRLKSASFAPFRRGQSPLLQRLPTPGQIEEDVASIQGLVGGVRTYTATEGLEAVPRSAGKYGLKVTHGAWIGADRQRNEIEVAALINQANRYPQAIERVIVGNEVLLRGELKPDELAGYIRRVRQSVRQPVSYAEVWEFWLRHPQLAREVDFVTVHFLPYWEDQPVGVAHAMDHIVAIYDQVRRAFPGKPILIGEVGWPSAGRSRQGALPGRAMQAQFVADFTRLAAERGMDYNLVEAFDQPWKTALEGTVGGNWGVLDAERHAKYPPAGPVVEHPHWRVASAGAAALGALATLSVLTAWPGTAAAFALAFLAQALAAMLAISAYHGVNIWHDKSVFAAPLLQFALQAALAGMLFLEATRALAGLAAPAPVAGPGHALARFGRTRWRDRLLALSVVLALYETLWLAIRPDLPELRPVMAQLPDGALYWIYQIFDGRYRDFPVPAFLVPSAGLGLTLAVLFAFGNRPVCAPSPAPIVDATLATFLVVAVALLQYVEGFANREALGWSGMALALALLPLGSLFARRAPA